MKLMNVPSIDTLKVYLINIIFVFVFKQILNKCMYSNKFFDYGFNNTRNILVGHNA